MIKWHKQEVKYLEEDAKKAIEQCVHHKRNREIVRSRLLDELSYDELAAKYHLDSRQIQRIVYREQDIVFRYMEKLNMLNL